MGRKAHNPVLRARSFRADSYRVNRAALGTVVVAVLTALSFGRLAPEGGAATTTLPKVSLSFPYDRPTTVKSKSDDVKAAWWSWKSAHITSNNTGPTGRFRVIGEPKDGSTFSEGMGYGMLFASLMDEQPLFDGLWRFTADHLDSNGLMHWKIGAPHEYRGTGAATDGDEDMAMGLVQACVKTRTGTWPASALDYCAIGTTLINNIYAYEIDRAGPLPKGAPADNRGGELLPGDSWDTTNKPTVNLSYFAPAYFRVFGAFTGRTTEWNSVVARNYELLNQTQAIAGNCSKLIPNWNDYEGNVRQVDWQPQNSGWWSWDAARVGVRIALDRAWSASPESIETSNEIGSFFASVGIENVKAEYGLDGTAKNSYTSPFFISNAAAPIWAATKLTPVKCGAANGSLLSSPQSAYDTNLAQMDRPESYYSNAWRLMSMMLMSGNFPNLYAESIVVAQAGDPLAFSTPVKVNGTPTPAKPKTSTPRNPRTKTKAKGKPGSVAHG